jgi:hypothetical protein
MIHSGLGLYSFSRPHQIKTFDVTPPQAGIPP